MTCLRTLSVHGNVLLRTVLQVPKVGTVMYQQNTTYLLSITTKGIANYSQHKILPHHFTTTYSLENQTCRFWLLFGCLYLKSDCLVTSLTTCSSSVDRFECRSIDQSKCAGFDVSTPEVFKCPEHNSVC